MTVIPEALVTQWEFQKHSEVQVRGYNGQRSKRPTYLVDILIGEHTFTAVKVTVSQRANILLGRDVMNQLYIFLNGPRQILEIYETETMNLP